MGFFQGLTNRGIFLQIIASRKTVPPRMLRIVPLGDLHIFFSLNSSTLASSGVMVAHFIPTLYFLIASAQSIVTARNKTNQFGTHICDNKMDFNTNITFSTRTLIIGSISVLYAKIVCVKFNINKRKNQFFFDYFPNYPKILTKVTNIKLRPDENQELN